MLNFATCTLQADDYHLHGSLRDNAEGNGKVCKHYVIGNLRSLATLSQHFLSPSSNLLDNTSNYASLSSMYLEIRYSHVRHSTLYSIILTNDGCIQYGKPCIGLLQAQRVPGG